MRDHLGGGSGFGAGRGGSGEGEGAIAVPVLCVDVGGMVASTAAGGCWRTRSCSCGCSLQEVGIADEVSGP